MNRAQILTNNINDLIEKKEEVWDRENPKKSHKKLTGRKKAKAKARAKANGRPYPNAVDNIWASKHA